MPSRVLATWEPLHTYESVLWVYNVLTRTTTAATTTTISNENGKETEQKSNDAKTYSTNKMKWNKISFTHISLFLNYI